MGFCYILCRKKAKTSKSAATAIVTDNVQSSSIDNNDKPKSDGLEKETENDLPVSQCQPMLLSQSGKFIPKFMAKKKNADCVVKIERASKPAETDNCSMPLSETETGRESQTLGTSSPADEVRHGAHADIIVATDTVTDEPVLVECVAVLEASEHGASDREKSASPNNGRTESIGSNTHALPVDTALQLNDIVVNDHSNNNDCEGCTGVEENENRTPNADILDEKKHSANVDQHDVSEAAKLSFSTSNDVRSEAAVCTPAAETAPVTMEDCTEPTDLQISGYENTSNQPPVDTDRVSGGDKAVSTDDVTAATVQSELIVDASEHIQSVVAELGTSVSSMPVAVPENVEARTDAESNDSGEKVETYDSTENNGGNIKSDILRVDGEIASNNKTEVGHFDAVPVNGAEAKDWQAETGDNIEVGTVSKAREFITGSSESAIFDDFLDLTDSQLCQLDDVSR